MLFAKIIYKLVRSWGCTNLQLITNCKINIKKIKIIFFLKFEIKKDERKRRRKKNNNQKEKENKLVVNVRGLFKKYFLYIYMKIKKLVSQLKIFFLLW